MSRTEAVTFPAAPVHQVVQGGEGTAALLDDGDDALEALESVITTTANASGDWSVDIGITLAPTQGLRTNIGRYD